MNNVFNCTCTNEKVCSSYLLSDDKSIITADPLAKERTFCPFDTPEELVVAYLNIGYTHSMGGDLSECIMSFVSRFGMPSRNAKKLNIRDFVEDAEALYLHFAEISTKPYPSNPEWVLETEPSAGVILGGGKNPILQWQTSNLSEAVELAYTILLCSDIKKLGLCKHCQKPFYAKNPKSEFCSPSCRNRFNVYKSRSKN